MVLSRNTLIMALVLLFAESVRAGKDKETPPPTSSFMPTPAPTITPKPSIMPSYSPSAGPTSGPTLSFSPTATASEMPTPLASAMPSNMPSGNIRTVEMPRMSIALKTTSRSSVNFFLNEALEKFFADELLSTGKYYKSFQSVSLNSLVEQDSTTADIKITGTAVYATNTEDSRGNIVRVPSEEELSKIVTTYFSFFGIQDLQDYILTNLSLPISEVSSVSVNGEKLADSNGSVAAVSGSAVDTSNNSDNLNGFIIAGIVVGGLLLSVAVALFVRSRRVRQAKDQREIVVIESLEEGGGGGGNKAANNNSSGASVKSNTESASKDDSGGGIESAPIRPTAANSNAANAVLARASASPFQYPVGQQQQEAQHSIQITNPFDGAHSDDDGGDDYTSDGDIVSVTESLHFEEKNQGPLFNVSSGAGPTQPASETIAKHVAMTGKSSVRAASKQSFQYDASRLDQVLSSAKGTINDDGSE